MESGINSTNLESHLIQNPSSTDKYWNAVPGIQNPRLFWIPLHGATSQEILSASKFGSAKVIGID